MRIVITTTIGSSQEGKRLIMIEIIGVRIVLTRKAFMVKILELRRIMKQLLTYNETITRMT